MEENLTALLGLFVIGLVLAGAIGWTMNLIGFVTADFKEPYAEEIVRGVGIPIPIIGAVAGYIDFEDEEDVK